MPHKKDHLTHQQLMRQLSLCNIKIKAHSSTMRLKKGKLPRDDWEALVRALKRLEDEKAEINKALRKSK